MRTAVDYFVGLLAIVFLILLSIGGWLGIVVAFLGGAFMVVFGPLLVGVFFALMCWEALKEVGRWLRGQ